MTSTSQVRLDQESESVQECPEAMSEELFEKSAEAFRTIGEAAGELGLKTHVLRFWETKFDNLRPLKRTDGRRYYRAEDMELLRKLQNLLHVQGLTIRGAVKAMGDGPGAVQVSDEGAEDMALPVETGASVRDLQDAVRDAVERGDFRESELPEGSDARERLECLLADLTRLKSRLDAARAAA
jgi:DNA-binding transcriptional MerR regulator